MAFLCIYCLRDSPTVTPSEAHIFPYVMGGTEATGDTVCLSCNDLINKRVEMPALTSFLPFQSMFGIRGRRGTVKRIRGTLMMGELHRTVSLNERGEITDAVVFPGTDASGKKTYYVCGPAELVEPKLRTLSERYPDIKWHEGPARENGKLFVEIDSNLSGPHFRRLATKVAFERFAQFRTATFVADDEYDPLRDFILEGIESTPISGVLSDRRILDGPLKVLPVPCHAVYVVSHPLDPVLGAFVCFYGLFFYWVILSRKYRALGQTDELLVENPQAREATSPLLRARSGAVRVPWNEVISPYLKDPIGVEKTAMRYAKEKFQAAADAFYGPGR